MAVKIILAKIADIDLVTSILNRVTLDLLEMGIRQWRYPWQPASVKKEIGLHNVYLVKVGEEVVGTFFLGTQQQIESLGVTRKALYLSRIAVLPDYQGMSFGTTILRFCEEAGVIAGLSVYLDCWSGNEKLKTFYQQQNCHYLGDFSEADYQISGFQLNLKDG
ncbi:GNAT family N-acetyltransferase [Vagococcus sp. BWB3-3]|uniref:GNAT family N-acetyltransferase n=1 Tax=Vagococcus allomyrinae TaxID=2794353 RepID=A0A940PF62_9ENTE|nr:GNAT family N-acetyltransferase [Vagococcus allomyrinae]MBP1041708.1 GNAT family N-acetyltransferase [Vagococcus allomyrinae]